MSFRDQLTQVYKEIEIMKRMRGPNVVRLHEIIDDNEKEKLYMSIDRIFKEFCSYGLL
jgi:serine/threonine protein kinase